MIRLDSTKIEVPLGTIKQRNYSCFQSCIIEDDKQREVKRTAELKPDVKAVGLNSVKVDYLNEVCVLQLSSKILYDDYAEGININNIEQVLHNVAATGIIEFWPSAFIEQGSIFQTDETHHTHIENVLKAWPEIMEGLTSVCVNTRYTPSEYNMKNNKGIVYSSDHKSKKNRLTMYAKYLDLSMGKNKPFMKMCANPMKVLNDARNVLRVEANNTSFQTIRERFMLPKGKPTLKDVLTAQGRPCVYYLNDIAKPKKNMQLELIMQSEYTGANFLRMEGVKTIIRAADYDENVVKAIMLSKFSASMFKDYWYGTKTIPSVHKTLITLEAQDRNQRPGALNNTLQNIIEQLNEDYAL